MARVENASKGFERERTDTESRRHEHAATDRTVDRAADRADS